MGTADYPQNPDERQAVSNEDNDHMPDVCLQYPDGQPAVSNEDNNKETDLRQPRIIRTPTLPATSMFAHARQCAETQQEAQQKQQKLTHAIARPFSHFCVGGKVPKSCEKCRASYAAGYVCQDKFRGC